jgi:hypothetical protein
VSKESEAEQLRIGSRNVGNELSLSKKVKSEGKFEKGKAISIQRPLLKAAK